MVLHLKREFHMMSSSCSYLFKQFCLLPYVICPSWAAGGRTRRSSVSAARTPDGYMLFGVVLPPCTKLQASRNPYPINGAFAAHGPRNTRVLSYVGKEVIHLPCEARCSCGRVVNAGCTRLTAGCTGQIKPDGNLSARLYMYADFCCANQTDTHPRCAAPWTLASLNPHDGRVPFASESLRLHCSSPRWGPAALFFSGSGPPKPSQLPGPLACFHMFRG